MYKKYNALLAEIGRKITAQREQLGMSGINLAIQADLSASQLSQYETGTCMMRIDKLIRISEALHVPLSYFHPEKEDCSYAASGEEAMLFRRISSLPQEKRMAVEKLIRLLLALL